MNGSKKPYSLDEYYKDRYGGQMAVSPLNRTASRSSGSVFSRPPAPAGALQKRQQILSSMNVTEKSQQPTAPTQPAPTQQATGAASIVQQPEQGGALTQSQLTTADTMRMMEDAMASLVEWGNRKFVYNAKESPLYTILQQQAEKEARLASGRAYSRAVANTGGFGSSYATLAAEEAGRQVMEGLDDQQLALYQAAREEFDAERQSALDWYNTTKQLYEDAYLLEQDEKQKAALEERELTETAISAAQELQNAFGTDFSENTQREYLASKGYSEADIDSAIESQRKIASGLITDYKAGDVVSAIKQAQTLDEAYRNGVLTEQEYNAGKTQNSEVIKNGILKEIKNESTEADALATAESAVVSGALSMSDYQDILVTNAKAELKDIDEGKGTDLKKAKKVLAIINAVLADVDRGVMNQDEADTVIREISMTEAARRAWERIQLIGYWSDEHIRRLDEEEEEAYRALAKEIEIQEKFSKKVAKKAGEQDQMEAIKKRFER